MNSQTPYDGMPSDFEDIEGWNSYYTAFQATGRHLDAQRSYSDLLAAYFVFLNILHHTSQKIWFPGCGASLAPHVYAALGFRVWASDISKVAIQIQEQLRQLPLSDLIQPEGLKQMVASAPSTGELHLCVHDFRQPFDEGDFDMVLNVKAFPRLSWRSMKLAAAVHWQALQPKGQVIFWTLSGGGDRRDQLETILIKAGFLVPGHQTRRWYRRAAATQRMLAKVLNFGSAILNRRAECDEVSFGMPKAWWDSLRRDFDKRLAHEEAEIQYMLKTRRNKKLGRFLMSSI